MNNLPSPCLGCGGYGREHKSFCRKQYDQVAESVREHAASAEHGLIHDNLRKERLKAIEEALKISANFSKEITELLKPYCQNTGEQVATLKRVLADYESLKKKVEGSKPTYSSTTFSVTSDFSDQYLTDKALLTNPPTTAMHTMTLPNPPPTLPKASKHSSLTSNTHWTWLIPSGARRIHINNFQSLKGNLIVWDECGIKLYNYVVLPGQWSSILPEKTSYLTSDCLTSNQVTFSTHQATHQAY